jgi:transposase-like protein
MPESARLNGASARSSWILWDERRHRRALMKLSIQFHPIGLSLSNTVSILDILGVERARSTVHNWIHKADLQPDSG